jgi:hypothetical protein
MTTVVSRMVSCLAMLAAGFVMFAAVGMAWAQNDNCPTPEAKTKRDGCYSAAVRECAGKYNVQTTSFRQCDIDARKSCGVSAGCQ